MGQVIKKTEAQVAEEKLEMERLRKEIVELTDRIPAKVMNETDFYGAKTFKKVAMDARKRAQSVRPTLASLRTARSSLVPYYG